MNPELEKIYNSLPTIECQLKCFETCANIKPDAIEEKAIEQFCLENNIPYAQVKEPIEKLYMDSISGNSKVCSYLKNNQCTIYSIRPIICRLWGIVEGMRCNFGCKVNGKILTNQEASKILRKVRALLV